MRMYGEIWYRLKKEKTVSVTANRLLHARILKAVHKEKGIDLAYKLQIEPRKAVMTHSSKHAVLTFYLEIKIPTKELAAFL